MTLAELKIGQTATILSVGGEGGLRQHFLDMGVLPGVPITLVKYAPMGDPMELRVHGYELTLRRADARKIEVRRTESGKRKTENFEENGKQPFTFPISDSRFPEPEHPGLGEGGHYHQEQERERQKKENLMNGKRKTEKGKLLDKTFNVQRSTTPRLPLPWWETRIVARQRFSTN